MKQQNKRDYNNNYPSVTTILGVLRKIGLEMWFKCTPINQINKESEQGKLIGTQIHQAIHDYIKTNEVKVSTQYAEEVMNALKGFMQFRKEHPEFKLKNAEIVLTSEKYKYNGTLDCLAEKETLVILDWKTGKIKDKVAPPIYDEYLYQVAAYVYAYNEVNNVSIDKAYILAVAKDKIAYNFYEMDKQEIDDCFNEVFLPTLKIYNYQRRKNAEG